MPPNLNAMVGADAAVTLEPVTRESASILENLFELYAYEFSEHMPLRIKASGRFEVRPGDAWWTAADHFGYLLKLGDELAGFALVRTGSRVTEKPDVMDVAEFFVLRGVRRRGIGMSAAHALFGTFPRAWEIRVRRTNVAALEFWSQAAAAWVRHPVAPSPFRVDGVDWDVLRFVTSSG